MKERQFQDLAKKKKIAAISEAEALLNMISKSNVMVLSALGGKSLQFIGGLISRKFVCKSASGEIKSEINFSKISIWYPLFIKLILKHCEPVIYSVHGVKPKPRFCVCSGPQEFP